MVRGIWSLVLVLVVGGCSGGGGGERREALEREAEALRQEKALLEGRARVLEEQLEAAAAEKVATLEELSKVKAEAEHAPSGEQAGEDHREVEKKLE